MGRKKRSAPSNLQDGNGRNSTLNTSQRSVFAVPPSIMAEWTGSELAPARRTQQPSTPWGAQACWLPPVIQPRIRFPINCVDYLHLVLEDQNSLHGPYGDVSAHVTFFKWAVCKNLQAVPQNPHRKSFTAGLDWAGHERYIVIL